MNKRMEERLVAPRHWIAIILAASHGFFVSVFPAAARLSWLKLSNMVAMTTFFGIVIQKLMK